MKKNKHVIQFLTKFFLVYFSLIGIYNIYLKNTQQKDGIYSCSPVTKMVTNHSEKATEFLGYDVYTDQNFNELSMMFKVNDKYVVRIVEGCTSVSIIILFLAFIVAFSGSVKATILYGVSGVLLIYLTNIFRIVFISLGVYHYPQYEGLLHRIIFPGLIYSMVFLLWVIWVKKYAKVNLRDA
ncbi:MAG: exosortase family protein XrtF [Candidatus Azotimanducaceae bacterium]